MAGKPTITVELIGDTVCAWTWVGKRYLEEAMEQRQSQANFHVRWRSVFLDEKFMGEKTQPHLEWLASEYGTEVAEKMKEKKLPLFTMGWEKGIDFDTSRHMADSTRSHCLIHYAGTVSLNHQERLVELLLKEHFINAANIGSAHVLLEAAKEVGLDIAASKAAMEDETLKKQVWSEHRKARDDLGVKGLPFFVISLEGGQDGEAQAFLHDKPTESIVAVFDKLIAKAKS